jgi:hypothetical protein
MPAPHDERSFAAPRILRWAAGLTLLFLSMAFRSPPQSAGAPVPTPSNQQPKAVAPTSPQADSSPPSPPKPAPPAKSKKVITNDDLATPSNGQSLKPADGDSGSFLTCEATCEQQAREEAGYASDREAEWQMQVVNARRELVADTEWRGLLSEALQQSNTYCNFLAQQSQKVSPSGNSYNARLQRAKADQYFEKMDRVLRQKLQTLANRMTSRTNEVGALSPVRASMMYVQGTRILQRVCQFPPPQ